MDHDCYYHPSRNSRETYTTTVSKRNSTADDDFIKNRTNSMTLSSRQNSKKPFLKKGSRKFLASSIVEHTSNHNTNPNTKHNHQIQSRSARSKVSGLSKSKNSYQENVLMQVSLNSGSISNSNANLNFNIDPSQNQLYHKSHNNNSLSLSNNRPSTNISTNIYPKKQTPHPSPKTTYIPPDLLISRLKGKIVSTTDKPSTLRRIYDDGRIQINFKQQEIIEEYLNDIVFTQYQSGDFKLQWQEKTISWIQKHQCYQIQGEFIFPNSKDSYQQ